VLVNILPRDLGEGIPVQLTDSLRRDRELFPDLGERHTSAAHLHDPRAPLGLFAGKALFSHRERPPMKGFVAGCLGDASPALPPARADTHCGSGLAGATSFTAPDQVNHRRYEALLVGR
jgi:hypothetical protein